MKWGNYRNGDKDEWGSRRDRRKASVAVKRQARKKIFAGTEIFCMWLHGSASGKEPACQCRRQKRHRFDLCVRKIRRSAWQPTPVFLPGEPHGQRSLADCSLWGCRESDMTEATACDCIRVNMLVTMFNYRFSRVLLWGKLGKGHTGSLYYFNCSISTVIHKYKD